MKASVICLACALTCSSCSAFVPAAAPLLQYKRLAAAQPAVKRARALMTIAESSTAAASSSKTPEADKLEFVQLLGKLTPSPSEGSTENEAELVAAAVAEHLEQVLNGPFLLWLETKIGLSETMGNQVCILQLLAKLLMASHC
jgi:hypothetical protein